MRRLLLLLSLTTLLFPSSILNTKVYDRDTRVDLLLSFDTVYMGTVSKYERNGKTYLILPGANIKTDREFTFTRPFLKSVNIYKSSNRTLIEMDAPDGAIKITKVAPGYGLRIRTTQKEKPLPIDRYKTPAAQSAPKVGENVEDLTEKYLIVGVFVGSLLLLLLLIKIMATRRLGGSGKGGTHDAQIIYNKAIDAKNKLLLIEFNHKHHLVLMGAAGNVLIDSIAAESPADDFNALLRQNSDSLEKYLSSKDSERLKAYKNKLNRK